jgi:uncharacterized Fe-S cluster protein YjdI
MEDARLHASTARGVPFVRGIEQARRWAMAQSDADRLGAPGSAEPGAEFDDRDPTPDDPMDRMERGRAYRADGITVYFNARKCWHTGVCLRGLPLVFDVRRRPWVRADLDTPERIAAQIEMCPSGALSYELTGQAPEERDAAPKLH